MVRIDHIKQIKHQLQQGKLDIALEMLNVEENEYQFQTPEGCEVAGELYLRKKEFRKGLWFFIKALRKSKESLVALNGCAICLQELNKNKCAEKFFIKCASTDDSASLKNLANFYYQLEQYKKSAEIFDVVDAEKISSTDCLNFATSLHKLNLNYKALKIIRKRQLINEELSTKLYLSILSKSNHRYLALKVVDHLIKKSSSNTPIWLVLEKAKLMAILQSNSNAAEFLESAALENNKILMLTYEAGAQYIAANQFRDALRCLNRALAISPNDVNTHLALGNCYSNLYNYDSAQYHYDFAISLEGYNATALYNLGSLYHKKQEYSSAEDMYLKAIKSNAKHVASLRNLSSIYMLQGRNSEAKNILYELIKLSPNDATSFRHLVMLGKDEISQELFDLFLKNAGDPATKDGQKAEIYFSLYEVLQHKKNYSDAYRYLELGNFHRRAELGYEQKDELQVLKDVKEFFIRLPSFEVSVSDSIPQPIFIVGMPRSGTSLIEQIISKSSNVTAKGELDYLTHSIKNFINRTDLDFAQRIQYIRDEYLRLSTDGVTTKFFTDKMPLNFRWIGFIRLCFPNSKIVHVERSPLPTLWSNYKVYFSKPGNGYIYNWNDLTEFFDQYQDLMTFWHNRFDTNVVKFNYEKLISNPHETIKGLYGELGLHFKEEVLDFKNINATVNTASFAQVKKGLYHGSNEDWRNYRVYIPDEVISKYLT